MSEWVSYHQPIYSIRCTFCGCVGLYVWHACIVSRCLLCPPPLSLSLFFPSISLSLTFSSPSTFSQQDPPNITTSIHQNVLFYNLSFVSTTNTKTIMLPLSSYGQLCATGDSCNHNVSLTGSGTNYRVSVVAGNIVGTGEPLTCDGQIGK